MKEKKLWPLFFLSVILTLSGIIIFGFRIRAAGEVNNTKLEIAEISIQENENNKMQIEEIKNVSKIEIIDKNNDTTISNMKIIETIEIVKNIEDQVIELEIIETGPPEPIPSAKPLSGALIGIDAGHQRKGNSSHEPAAPNSNITKAKVSSGTSGVATRVPEYVINLDVALLLEQYLVELGAEVIMTRTEHDVDISNAERAILMNENNVDLCIRIHANGSVNSNIRGALLMLPKGEITKAIQNKSYTAGKIIYKNYIEETGLKDTGTLYVDDLTGFNWSTVPVILVEMGYMSNPEDDVLLTDQDFQIKCAKGMANGIVEWFQTEK